MGSLDKLKKKTPVRRDVDIVVTGDDGEAETVTLEFQSIGSKAYDDLVAKYPPKGDDKKSGLPYDVEKFAPALVAACCVEPDMTLEDALEIWQSDAWNRGELQLLFMAAIEVNSRGHNLPPTKSD